MRSLFLSLTVNLFVILSHAQVGIGTINPTNASMLEVSATVDGVNFGGLMPPRVSSQAERDLIPTSSSDIGLIVFVEDTGTLEIWNGIYWETQHTLSTQAVTLAIQDFDTNISWNYTLNPASTYNIDNDIWDIVTVLGSGSAQINYTSGLFLGCRDLNNPNGGGNFFHEIIFENIDIISVVNARLSFDYDIFEFDNGDDVRYEVFHDDISQGVVNFVNGNANLSAEGTEVINIPNSVTIVRITLGVIQNGANDFAAFDNFRVYGE